MRLCWAVIPTPDERWRPWWEKHYSIEGDSDEIAAKLAELKGNDKVVMIKVTDK